MGKQSTGFFSGSYYVLIPYYEMWFPGLADGASCARDMREKLNNHQDSAMCLPVLWFRLTQFQYLTTCKCLQQGNACGKDMDYPNVDNACGKDMDYPMPAARI